MHSTEMSNNQLVIAFDFYDGATEGLVHSVKQYSKCYFKLIAWDQSQDKRLYAVSEVDSLKYDKLLELLTQTQEKPSTPVWLLNWKFQSESDEREADNIIKSFQANLSSSKLLAFGEDICDSSLKLMEIDNKVIDKVNKALELDKPDDLSNWLAVLK